jgi:hypothetical protein
LPQKPFPVHRRKSLCVQTDRPLVSSRKLRSRSVFCPPAKRSIPLPGQPKDSRSRADSAYLLGRTQTMAILTIRRFMSSCESTINSKPAKAVIHTPGPAESPHSIPPDWGTGRHQLSSGEPPDTRLGPSKVPPKPAWLIIPSFRANQPIVVNSSTSPVQSTQTQPSGQ